MKSWSHGTTRAPVPLVCLRKSRSERRTMSYGSAVGIGDVVLAWAPVRGIDHRRDVVRLSRHRGDVLRDLERPGRSDAEDREAEKGPVGLEREPRLADEADDRALRRPAQPGSACSEGGRQAGGRSRRDVVDTRRAAATAMSMLYFRTSGSAKFVKPP